MITRPYDVLRAWIGKTDLRAIGRTWPDVLGVLVGAAYAIPTLAYPFGRDQAIFYYIGREWLHGTLPYRDAFDLKPPGVYALHSLAVLMFGAHQWSIRIADILCVLALGKVISLAVRRDGDRVRGELGAVVALLSGVYFTSFDFWDSGQAELWEAFFVIAGLAVLERIRSPLRAPLVSGILGCIALLFKFTAGLIVVPLGFLAVVRGWRDAGPQVTTGRRVLRSLAAGGLFALGTLVPVAIVVAYFAAHRASNSLWELIGYLGHYAQTGASPADARSRVEMFWLTRSGLWVAAFAGLWLAGSLRSASRRRWHVLSGAVFAALLVTLAFASVVAQKKYFSYHWGVVVPFLVLAAAYGLAELARWSPGVATLHALSVVLGGFLTAPPWYTNPALTYRTYALETFRDYRAGRLPREQFVKVFKGVSNYDYAAQEYISGLILQRARPGDLLHVRGFELAMYAITGMRTPCRFVSELPLDEPWLFFHRDQWLAQQNQALWSSRPRFIVTFVDRPWDVSLIASHGYHEIGRRGLFLLMLRND